MLLIAVVIYFVTFLHNVKAVRPLVKTKLGSIRGLRASNGCYNMYLGVPYAKVDDENPFGPCRSYPKFNEEFDASDDSTICPQEEDVNFSVTGSLDCLRLNIYVPDLSKFSTPLPVYVHIHGGRNFFGSMTRYTYDPSYIIKHGVIFVMMNYRLGPYGFMCLDTPEYPSNQGLKDQAAALRWIKENIAAFGGDDTKITLAGHSTGAVNVQLQILNKDRVFKRAIIQSALTKTWAIIDQTEFDKSFPLKIAKRLGFTTTVIDEAMKFISKSKTDDVIAASLGIESEYWPCIERNPNKSMRFVTNDTVASQQLSDMNILMGHTDSEKIYVYNQFQRHGRIPRGSVSEVTHTLQKMFGFDRKRSKKMEEIIYSFYMNDKTRESKEVMSDLISDIQFNYPTKKSAKSYFDNGANIYYYVFSYTGDRNVYRCKYNITRGGATHVDELGYIFDMPSLKTFITSETQIMIDRMTTLWTNFVKYGDPTPKTSELLPTKWDPISKHRWYYMNINTEMRLESSPLHSRMAFWDLFYKLNKKFSRNISD